MTRKQKRPTRIVHGPLILERSGDWINVSGKQEYLDIDIRIPIYLMKELVEFPRDKVEAMELDLPRRLFTITVKCGVCDAEYCVPVGEVRDCPECPVCDDNKR